MFGLLLPLAAAAGPGSVVVHVDGARPLGKAARPGETVVLARSGAARVGSTDPAGEVAFRGVSAGEWQVWRSLEPERPGCWEQGVVQVPAGEEAQVVFGTVAAADAATVSCGFVHEIPGKKEGEHRPGVFKILLPFDSNLGDSPVPIELKRASGRTVARLTVRAGANSFDGLRAGSYTLVAYPPRMEPVTRTVRLERDLGSKLTLDIHPPPAEGMVRVQVVPTHQRNPAGVVVHLEDRAGGVHTVTSDPSGWVTLAGIPAGPVSIWSQFAGDEGDRETVTLSVDQGLEHRLAVDMPRSEGTLRVIGVLPRYGPQYGVSSVLLAGTERVDTMVPVSGERVVQGVPSGDWTLHKASDGTPLCPQRVPVEDDATTVLWFEPTHTLRPCVYRVFPGTDAS
ncbi:MAG: hypothetical protein CL927_04120 [Deltaproteobacteria bacterium]|nr:hypothetical protein [Deltaproteobacteria bacterium]HCH63084.1 hypothetical protein [Deltaproteobacteria bacterium]